MDKIPPPPQAVPVIGAGGRLTTPWNLWLTAFIKILQDVGDQLDALGLGGSGGGGVATGGAGAAVDLVDYASGLGLLNLPAHADHKHLKLIGAETDGVNWGSVSALNVVTPGLEVAFEPNLTGSLLTDLFAYWSLDEGAGYPRLKRLGSATSADLAETGGTVASAAGKFSDAMSSTGASTTYLLSGSFASLPLGSGFTFAIWFYADSSASQYFSMFQFAGGGVKEFSAVRYPNGISAFMCWGPTTGDAIYLGNAIPSLSAWHLLLCWYDPAEGTFSAQIDDMPRASFAVAPADGAAMTANYTFNLTKNRGAPYVPWEGRLDAPMLWTRALTEQERSRVYVNYRASVGVSWPALELFGAA